MNTINKMIGLALAMSMSSCLQPRQPSSLGVGQGKSKLTEIKVKLPESTLFKPTSGSAVVNAIKLTIKPKDSDCSGATKVDETRSYADNIVSQKLAKGCDYAISLAIGEKTGAAFKAYYRNTTEKSVPKSELTGGSISVSMLLTRTSEGAAANMPESLGSAPTPTPPTPDKPVPPAKKELAAALKSASLKGPGSKTVGLADVFKSDYLLVDFSSLGCSYCITHAEEMNRDSAFQKMMDGSGKCTSAIVINQGQVDDWVSQFGAATFVGKSTFEFSSGVGGFGKLFGQNITLTPTVMLFDRDGKTVVQDARSDTAAVEAKCK
jgi:hypothetical protein